MDFSFKLKVFVIIVGLMIQEEPYHWNFRISSEGKLKGGIKISLNTLQTHQKKGFAIQHLPFYLLW
jgi:hypothetical protein